MKKCFSTKSSFLWLWHHSDFGQFFLLLSPNKSNNFFIYFLILLEASAPVNYICIVFAFLSVVKRGIDHWALNFTSCDNGLRTDIKDKVIPNNITAEPLFSIKPFFPTLHHQNKEQKIFRLYTYCANYCHSHCDTFCEFFSVKIYFVLGKHSNKRS